MRNWIGGHAWRGAGCALMATLILLGGCAGLVPRSGAYIPLSEEAGRDVIAGLQARTGTVGLVKLKFDCTFTMQTDDGSQTRSANALCLWQPGEALRVRVFHVGMAVADVLYDGAQWYVTLELASKVYICRRIGQVRSPSVPAAFFEKLATVPYGWLADATAAARVDASMGRYRVIDTTPRFSQTLEFEKRSAIPLAVEVSTPDGSAFSAELTDVESNLSYRAVMFAPMLEGYEVINLDQPNAAAR